MHPDGQPRLAAAHRGEQCFGGRLAGGGAARRDGLSRTHVPRKVQPLENLSVGEVGDCAGVHEPLGRPSGDAPVSNPWKRCPAWLHLGLCQGGRLSFHGACNARRNKGIAGRRNGCRGGGGYQTGLRAPFRHRRRAGRCGRQRSAARAWLRQRAGVHWPALRRCRAAGGDPRTADAVFVRRLPRLPRTVPHRSDRVRRADRRAQVHQLSDD